MLPKFSKDIANIGISFGYVIGFMLYDQNVLYFSQSEQLISHNTLFALCPGTFDYSKFKYAMRFNSVNKAEVSAHKNTLLTVKFFVCR